MDQAAADGAQRQLEWEELYVRYCDDYPELADEFLLAVEGDLPEGWDKDLTALFKTGKSMATRASSGAVLNELSMRIPNLVGGSADLTGSNKTRPQGARHVSRDDFSGRYIHFGIREHGMGGILNGMALHGGIRTFGGTFLVFSDYMRPTIRLAAMMGLPVVYVFTHDSIGLGEDGPTHQPIEQLMSLRLIPGLTVIRPAEATETAMAWQSALKNKQGPTALSLTRQGLETFDRTQLAPAKMAALGAYVLSDADDPAAILMASGSEVHIALEAQSLLSKKGIGARVVSMPSWELFESQPIEYRESVFPSHTTARVSMEAGVTLGWERYVGGDGTAIGIDRFGASAPFQEIYWNLGLTAEAMGEAVIGLLG